MSNLVSIHIVVVYTNNQQIEVDLQYDTKLTFRSLLDTINIQLHQLHDNNEKNANPTNSTISINEHSSLIGLYHSATNSIFEVIDLYHVLFCCFLFV